MSQFVFKRSKNTPSNESNSTHISNNMIKKSILDEYDKYHNLIKNGKLKELYNKLEHNSNEINSYITILKTKEKGPEADLINDKLNIINNTYNTLKKSYDEILKNELIFLYNNYFDIYELIINGLDRSTLEDVLTKFEEFSSGKINAKSAVNSGIETMINKYNLPSDFINKDSIKEYYENLD